LSLSQISWDSTLRKLSKKSKTIETLEKQGFHSLKDLLTIFPLRTQQVPQIKNFTFASVDHLFRGLGKVIDFQQRPNLRVKGKGGVTLTNSTLIVQDFFSSQYISLKWFNLYPSQAKSLKEYEYIYFTGTVSEFAGQKQITSPDIVILDENESSRSLEAWQKQDTAINQVKVTYPTIAGISPRHLKGVFDKIPTNLWLNINDPIPQVIREKRFFLSLQECFSIIHGQCNSEQISEANLSKCHERLLYNELIFNQVNVYLRKKRKMDETGQKINITSSFMIDHQDLFPYKLTNDQKSACDDIFKDFQKDYPMMRLIQGDVGSGKTTIALLSALAVVKDDYQVALMCPTETLAQQHYYNFKSILKDQANCRLLTGSLDRKTKKQTLEDMANGVSHITIGTHALIQKDVHFKKLAFVIIDEQHKFGVQQRIDLVAKGTGTHCIIMTATPIPRSLRLAQYGDLELSIIKELPSSRKGTQTRVVQQESYQKYLSFLKTRISMGEQAYVVVPAIEDNEEQNMLNLEVIYKKYCDYFPEIRINALHGKMKHQDKSDVFTKFKNKEIDILISTSVIEVGIDNPNATVMAILSPERFGLSSLHQLRGRVGRGNKKGFCFLVNDREISQKAHERLKVIEDNTDGFLIADEDLKTRGEGNLFGREQSGAIISQLSVDIFTRPGLLEWAEHDTHIIDQEYPDYFKEIVDEIASKNKNDHIVMTV
jgi:ATP-dependent DNA helicase RecG